MKINFNFFLFCLFFLAVPFCVSVAQTGPFSEDVSVSAIVSGGSTPGSGGGGGAVLLPKTSVRFSGMAYPLGEVSILESGFEKSKVLADELGHFSATFEEEFDDSVLYSLFAKDVKGERSLLLNYPVALKEGYLTHLSGIRFPPTITTDKSQVKAGDYLEVRGFAFSKSKVEIVIEGGVIPQKNSGEKRIYTTESKNTGEYKIIIPLLGFKKGEYIVYAKYIDDTRVSKLVRFVVADLNIDRVDLTINLPGDCNTDDKIDLIDFSVLAYWYKRPNPPVCVDLNKDEIVNLVDFSILAYYWTG